MTANAPQIEVGTYNLNYHPPLLSVVDRVEPILDEPPLEETLSPELLYARDFDRALGYIATGQWLDIHSFELSIDDPPEKNFSEQPGRFYPPHRQLRTLRHLGASTRAFLNMCHEAAPTGEADIPRDELALAVISGEAMPVANFIAGITIYTEAAYLNHNINRLLVSRTAVEDIFSGERSYRRSIGERQWKVIGHLLAHPHGPRLWPDYDRD